jgi:hypothetical protein
MDFGVIKMGSDAAGWFDRAMSVNREGFAAGHYEAAYHALMAALHFAEDLEDEGRLLRVAQVAGEQGRLLDSLPTPHRLSSRMAKARGHEGLFPMAMKQASVQARLAHMKNRSDQHDASPQHEPPESS